MGLIPSLGAPASKKTQFLLSNHPLGRLIIFTHSCGFVLEMVDMYPMLATLTRKMMVNNGDCLDNMFAPNP